MAGFGAFLTHLFFFNLLQEEEKYLRQFLILQLYYIVIIQIIFIKCQLFPTG